jgi:hypothetical protein
VQEELRGEERRAVSSGFAILKQPDTIAALLNSFHGFTISLPMAMLDERRSTQLMFQSLII